jgi:hypothetical protein
MAQRTFFFAEGQKKSSIDISIFVDFKSAVKRSSQSFEVLFNFYGPFWLDCLDVTFVLYNLVCLHCAYLDNTSNLWTILKARTGLLVERSSQIVNNLNFLYVSQHTHIREREKEKRKKDNHFCSNMFIHFRWEEG